jgi:hypothetical protein
MPIEGGMPRPQRDTLVPYGAAILLAIGLLFLFLRPEGSPSGDEAAIRAVIREDALTAKPENCNRLYTMRFVTQLYRHDHPLATCRQGQEAAEGFHIVSLKTSGYRATASVTYHDDSSPVSAVTVELVKAPTWKFDRLLDVTVDQPKLASLTRTGLLKKSSRPVGDCVASKLRRSDQAAVEQAFLHTGYEDLVERDVVACTKPAALRRQFASGLRQGAIKNGASGPEADCFAARVLRGVSVAELRSVLLGHRDLHERGKKAVALCRFDGGSDA